MPQTSNAWLHYRYWIGILVFISIELAALAFANVPGVGAYLNFALTIGSLLLSGLAIVYAFVSKESLAQNLGVLDTASRALLASADTVRDATTHLASQVEIIPRELSTMGARMDETLAALATPKLASDMQTTGTPVQLSDPGKVLARGSMAGMVITYALTRACVLNRPLDLELLHPEGGMPIPDSYSWGYIVALEAAGYIRTDLKATVSQVNVQRVPDEWTPGKIRDVIDNQVATRPRTSTERAADVLRVNINLAAIDASLSVPADVTTESKET